MPNELYYFWIFLNRSSFCFHLINGMSVYIFLLILCQISYLLTNFFYCYIFYFSEINVQIPYGGFESYSTPHCSPWSLTDVRRWGLLPPLSTLWINITELQFSKIDHRFNCMETLDLHRTALTVIIKTISDLGALHSYTNLRASLPNSASYFPAWILMLLFSVGSHFGASTNILFPIHDDRRNSESSIKSSLSVFHSLQSAIDFWASYPSLATAVLSIPSLQSVLRCFLQIEA